MILYWYKENENKERWEMCQNLTWRQMGKCKNMSFGFIILICLSVQVFSFVLHLYILSVYFFPLISELCKKLQEVRGSWKSTSITWDQTWQCLAVMIFHWRILTTALSQTQSPIPALLHN